jgi:uncharacterized protein YydD (DUF2326 family)
MIYRIYSDLPTFKEIEFKSGFNLLIADKSPGATDQHTRNRSGKSSLIEIIHFLLGSKCEKDSIFKREALKDFSFGMEFDLGNIRTSAERSGNKPSKILVKSDNFDNWPIQPNKKDGKWTISNENWKEVLGAVIFNLRGDENPDLQKNFAPTFRSLFSYFARREGSGAFQTPTKQSSMQNLYDYQVSLSYLIGLDWTIAQSWQIIRKREDALRELRKAAGEGAFGETIGTVANLRTELSVSEGKVRRMRKEIDEFKVLPQYRELEIEASNLSQKINKLSNENIIDESLKLSINESLEQEIPPAIDDLNRVYAEAGIILSEQVIIHFDKLKKFHESIIENRKSYLLSEIDEANRRINDRNESKLSLSQRWSEIMSLLKSHGALDQYSKMQSNLTEIESKTEMLRQKFLAAEQLEGQKTELDIERNRLLVRLRQDYQERKDILSHAIISFEEISNSLYENVAAGNLTISDSKNGPLFEVRIQGKESKGIKNMQTFCFDMMLIKLCIERNLSPGFVIHDSHLFDGVDERQIAKAFQIGSDMANRLGFQYIVTMNSDDIPKDFPTDFNINNYVLPVRLTDATENGGLFGKRF